MAGHASLLALALCLCCLTTRGESLKIGAFNVQIFGPSKLSQVSVVATLSQIVRRYDIILIQEIHDSSQTVIPSFLDTVNRDLTIEGVTYNVTISERLGRTRNKEQYAFLYRSDEVEVLDSYQFNDTADLFEREPFSVLIRSKTVEIPNFFLTAIHVQPKKAFIEINALVQVYDVLETQFNTANGIILGDFNADCSYLSNKKYNMLSLVTDGRFQWLINSSVDTTASSTDCSYDRIVTAGDMASYVVNGSARVVRFDVEYGLDYNQTLLVSDHYPVEVRLQGLTGSASGHVQFILYAARSLVCTLLAHLSVLC